MTHDDTWTAVCCPSGIPICEHGYCVLHRDDCEGCLTDALKLELDGKMDHLREHHPDLEMLCDDCFSDDCECDW